MIFYSPRGRRYRGGSGMLTPGDNFKNPALNSNQLFIFCCATVLLKSGFVTKPAVAE
jgi:hypothetical protein